MNIYIKPKKYYFIFLKTKPMLSSVLHYLVLSIQNSIKMVLYLILNKNVERFYCSTLNFICCLSNFFYVCSLSRLQLVLKSILTLTLYVITAFHYITISRKHEV